MLSNDVETTSIWYNILRDETGKKILDDGLPKLLELYQLNNIKSTFFFTAYIAKRFPEIVKMVIPFGHEVASHGKSHIKENGFDVMPYERQRRHLEESKKLLEDISGQEVISFRAPALRINQDTVGALIDSGFKIDSSIASQRFDFFMSFGGIKKLKWMFAPRLPYKTTEKSLFKRGNGPIVEVPLSAMVLPYIGTTMRMFPHLTALQRSFLSMENKINGKPIVFNIHPNELIDESDGKRIINRRVKNSFTYIIQDWARAKLKVKNLGEAALYLYGKEIKYFKENNYSFSTIKDYCKTVGLI
ncbi:MAG: polysaccharide deacetylase family protein [Ignavibacteriaceae bacterium]|nr:polysaccharide deacetylase family protein [Ignavibacteriaceae bacterium]